MNIVSLQVVNFRGLTKSFTFSGNTKTHAFVGKNGSGKTTVIAALRTIINGRGPDANNDAHISADANFCTMSAEIEGIGLIERKWNRGKAGTLRLNCKATSQKSLNELFKNQFGFDPTTVNIMSSNDIVTEMLSSGKDTAKYILGRIKNNDMTIDDILRYGLNISPEAEDELRQYFPAGDFLTLDDVELAYDYYKDQKTGLMTTMRELKSAAAFNGTPPTATSTAIDDQRNVLLQQIAEMEANAKAFNAAATAAAMLRQRIESLETELKNLPTSAPAASAITRMREKANDAASRAGIYTGQVESLSRTKTHLEEVLKNLANREFCPISGKLVCQTDKTGISSDIANEISMITADIDQARKNVQAAKDEYAAYSRRADEASLQRQNYEQRVRLSNELAQLCNQPQIAVPPKPDLSALPQMRQNADVLTRQYRVALDYERSLDAQRRLDALQASANIFAELVEALSPVGGVRQAILRHHAQILETHIASKGQKVLPKYEIGVSVDNGFKLTFKSVTTGGIVGFDSLSTGEKLRTVYLLTDMLSQLNGYKIIILDNLDNLDQEGLRLMMQVLKESSADYDRVFIGAIDSTDTMDVLSAYQNVEVFQM